METQLVLVLTCVWCLAGAALDTSELPTDLKTMDLRMRGVRPVKPDQYFCTGYKIEKNQYIVKFEALADAGTAHHILMFGCKSPASRSNTWTCGAVCERDEQIMFAWAKNAPALQLPDEVGRYIGPGAGIDYIVLQIHYARVFADVEQPDRSGIRIFLTQEPQRFMAGIYLLLAYDTIIPGNTEKVHADISCRFDWETSIFPFGFRTHAHSLGRVISGYRYNNNSFELIGKGNPQWPQAFYPVGKRVEVKPGDVLTAQCTYSSIGRDRVTRIGGTHNDEMCNFYIMYYMEAAKNISKGPETCAGNNIPLVAANLPADSDTPLPPNPVLEEDAKGHAHHTHMGGNGEGPKVSEPHNVAVPSHKGILNDEYDTNGVGNIGVSDKNNHYIQGNRQNSASNSKSSFTDDYSSYVARPNTKLLSYYDYPDYYDIIRQRNRVKKPLYEDFLGSRMSGFTDYIEPDKMMSGPMMGGPSKSRNRNKFFEAANQHYNDYDIGKTLLDSSSLSSDSLNSLIPSRDPSGSLKSKGSNSNESGKSTPKLLSKQVTAATAKADTEPSPHPKMNLKFVSSVPKSYSVFKSSFGQVGGVATNEEGDVYIFHRGSRIWNSLSFNLTNVYQMQDMAVETDPVVIIDKNDKIKRSFGKNLFYLPHGLTVDKKGNVWVTDVALHQVFRFPAYSDIPDLTLGERFVPGSDDKHFCKPTDIAVMSTGDFFVSDGYCNARVMKFDSNGNFLKQWGMTNGANAADGYPYPSAFNVPHSITLAEDRGLVCVADRENGRIQCFDLEGDFIRQMHPPSFGAYLYAIEYCPLHGGVLFSVNGPDYSDTNIQVQGFTMEIDTGKLRAVWNMPGMGLSSPHDITVHSPSHTVYVGELNPAKVWKFEMTDGSSEGHKQLTAAETSPLLDINAPASRIPPIFPGHHRYKDPTPFFIPTAGDIKFPDYSGLTTESVPGSFDVQDQQKTKSELAEVLQEKVKSNSGLPVEKNDADLNTASKDSEILHAAELGNPKVIIHLEKTKKIKKGEDSFAPALIIGLLLVVPVILLVIITVVVRLYQTAASKQKRHLGDCSKRNRKKKIKFKLGNILNSHKGFDRLSTEDDDHDIDVALDDSDQEEFNIKNSKA